MIDPNTEYRIQNKYDSCYIIHSQSNRSLTFWWKRVCQISSNSCCCCCCWLLLYTVFQWFTTLFILFCLGAFFCCCFRCCCCYCFNVEFISTRISSQKFLFHLWFNGHFFLFFLFVAMWQFNGTFISVHLFNHEILSGFLLLSKEK